MKKNYFCTLFSRVFIFCAFRRHFCPFQDVKRPVLQLCRPHLCLTIFSSKPRLSYQFLSRRNCTQICQRSDLEWSKDDCQNAKLHFQATFLLTSTSTLHLSSPIYCKGTSFTKLQSPPTSRKEDFQYEFEGRTPNLWRFDPLQFSCYLFQIIHLCDTRDLLNGMELYALSVLSIRVYTTIEPYAWARKRRHTRSHTPSRLFLGRYWGTSTSADRQEPTSKGAQYFSVTTISFSANQKHCIIWLMPYRLLRANHVNRNRSKNSAVFKTAVTVWQWCLPGYGFLEKSGTSNSISITDFIIIDTFKHSAHLVSECLAYKQWLFLAVL